VVNEVTQVDLIDRVVEKAKEAIPSVPEEVDKTYLDSLYQFLIQENAELESLGGFLRQEQEKERQMKESLQWVQDDLNRVVEARSQFESQKKALEEVAAAHEESRKRLAFLADSLDNRPQVKSTEEADKALKEARDALSEGERIRAEAANLKRAKDSAQESLDRLRQEESDDPVPEKGSELLEEEERRLSARVSELKAGISALEKEVSEVQLSIDSGICQACGRPFDNATDIDEKKARLEELSVSLGEAQEEMAHESDRLRTVFDELVSARRAEEDARVRSARIESLEKSIRELSEQESGLGEIPSDEETDLLRQAVAMAEKDWSAAYEEASTVASINSEIESLIVRHADLQEKMYELENSLPNMPSDDKLSNLVARAESLQKELAKVSDSVYRTTLDLSSRTQSYQAKAQEYQSLAEKHKQYVSLHTRAKNIKALIRYLRKNRDRFLEDAWEQIMQYAGEFSSLCTDGEIKAMGRSSEGEFVFDEGDGMQPVISASGLQKAVMGLGVRMALAESLSTPSDFMLLDEVTAGATDERSLAVTRALSASGIQAISVTHRHGDSTAAENVIQL